MIKKIQEEEEEDRSLGRGSADWIPFGVLCGDVSVKPQR
jgi:hypothetical protein